MFVLHVSPVLLVLLALLIFYFTINILAFVSAFCTRFDLNHVHSRARQPA
ncbi:hypothetical protein HMPREF1583_01501 [Gardnerella vaginalis JCP8151B]|nr:hypothetical protein HMPREF1586_01236 [Gardnerella vaginalis JCP8522]EPI44869.1 hypothetical protein HMPREF1583_01501 [Gardnerella vaginalis JCP8151B]EPI45106.1 hypothetical protein HMPREF1582_01450 [Gardnerella vaginalis JCP8151A]